MSQESGAGNTPHLDSHDVVLWEWEELSEQPSAYSSFSPGATLRELWGPVFRPPELPQHPLVPLPPPCLCASVVQSLFSTG
jgi:hypothetical protein